MSRELNDVLIRMFKNLCEISLTGHKKDQLGTEFIQNMQRKEILRLEQNLMTP